MHNKNTMCLVYVTNQIFYSFMYYTRSLIQLFKSIIKFSGFLPDEPVLVHRLITGFWVLLNF